VPLVVAAVLPHPPVIVPELAAGAAHELDALRTACDEAVARVLDARPGIVCLVGSGPQTRTWWYPYRASFAPWGVPVEARLGNPGPDSPFLPLSLAVGVWLLARATPRRATTWFAETWAVDAPPETCAERGERMNRGTSVGLLVLGDGSACRTLKAPGYLDPRAEPYDAAVTAALAKADVDAIRALDPVLSAELMVTGRAPWQVLAAAAAGRPWTGDVLYDDAPYGVQYTVATWLPA
jgi:hypothetical protein